jgi:MOSC domain-containing protein YiiM
MSSAQLISVCVGKAAPLLTRSGTVLSAIAKQPVSTLRNPVRCSVNTQGLHGDESVEPGIHGAPTQAIYLYPSEHYAFWQQLRAQFHLPALPDAGALGENLLVSGLLEREVWVGDQLTIGSVLLRVTRPREPCFKLDIHLQLRMAAKMMMQSGFSGFYASVVSSGHLQAGDPIRVTPGQRQITIAEHLKIGAASAQRALF